MDSHRTIARSAGALYIFGTVICIIGISMTEPLRNTPDFLAQVSANERQFIAGSLCWLAMSLALAMIPVVLFPVLRPHNEILAIGYVVFRGGLESCIGILMAGCQILLVLVSREYAVASASDAASLQTLGTFVRDSYATLNPLLVIVFSLDAVMLYAVLYQSKLIPRWISGWGIVAILLHLATAFLILFRIVQPDDTSTLWMFNVQIFAQEMLMAGWLIVRGFRQSAAVPVAARGNAARARMRVSG